MAGNTTNSVAICSMALELCCWIEEHPTEATSQDNKLTSMLGQCLPRLSSKSLKGMKAAHHKMWSRYHTLRTSQEYIDQWETFLHSTNIIRNVSAMVYQYVGYYMFKVFVQSHFSMSSSAAGDEEPRDDVLTYEEMNALVCSAGYVIHALQKKLRSEKSPSRLTKNMLLCLEDMKSSDEDGQSCSTHWIELVKRGGLSSLTYEIFLAMELELRTHLQLPSNENFIQQATCSIKSSEDVLFFWSMISAGWDEVSATHVLDRVISLWITIRGFSHASIWIEK